MKKEAALLGSLISGSMNVVQYPGIKIHLHPYRMHLNLKGLSHGLKTVRRTIFAPVCALGPAFRAPLHTKKEAALLGSLFFGARDGTRTHTAITTRTSNVLVYHSNTLASA